MAHLVDPFQPMVATESGVQLFQHEHLSHVSFNIFSKLPVLPLRHMGDLHRTVNQRIALLVLQSRIQSRYAELDHEHYKRCELDHSDSAREGCTVSTVTVTCEPLHWKYALQVAVEEARRLKQHGLTLGELTRFKSAMMRDSEQLAQQAGFVPSLENLDFVMEHDALGHVVMDQVQGHEALLRLDDVICLEGVNEVARELLGFFAEYGKDATERDPVGGLTTAIVACVPSTTTDNDGVEVPFSIFEQDVIAVLSADYGEIDPIEDVFVPDELLSETDLDELVKARTPTIVSSTVDEKTGVHQRVLSNGIRVNYRVTNNEPGSAFLRLVVPGGRTAESTTAGPGGIGAAAVGFRTLQEVGAVGPWSRKQVELITMQNLVMFEGTCCAFPKSRTTVLPKLVTVVHTLRYTRLTISFLGISGTRSGVPLSGRRVRGEGRVADDPRNHSPAHLTAGVGRERAGAREGHLPHVRAEHAEKPGVANTRRGEPRRVWGPAPDGPKPIRAQRFDHRRRERRGDAPAKGGAA